MHRFTCGKRGLRSASEAKTFISSCLLHSYFIRTYVYPTRSQLYQLDAYTHTHTRTPTTYHIFISILFVEWTVFVVDILQCICISFFDLFSPSVSPTLVCHLLFSMLCVSWINKNQNNNNNTYSEYEKWKQNRLKCVWCAVLCRAVVCLLNTLIQL